MFFYINIIEQCACVFLGYSLQLQSQSEESSVKPNQGEWMSSVMPITNNWLCVSLNLSVPATFHVSVNLLTDTITKTVYTVENVLGETLATDIVTVFEVEVDTTQTTSSQLVVSVSEGTVIRNVDVRNEHCSKFVT